MTDATTTTPSSSTPLDAAQEEATLAVVVRYASAFVGALSERQLWDAIARAVKGVAFKDGASVKRHCEWLLRVKRQDAHEAHEQLTEKVKELLDKVEALGVCSVEDQAEEKQRQDETTTTLVVEPTVAVETQVIETAAVETPVAGSEEVHVVETTAEEAPKEARDERTTSTVPDVADVETLTVSESGIRDVVVEVEEENAATGDVHAVMAPTPSEAEGGAVVEPVESEDDEPTIEELRAAARRQAENTYAVSEAEAKDVVEAVESEDDDPTIEELRAAARRHSQPTVSVEVDGEGIPNPKSRSPTPSVEKTKSKSQRNDDKRDGRLHIEMELDVSATTAITSLPTRDHDEEMVVDEDDAQVSVLASTSVTGDGDQLGNRAPPPPGRWWETKAGVHRKRMMIDVERDEQLMRITMELRPFATFDPAEVIRRNQSVLEAAEHPLCTTATRMARRRQKLVHVYQDPKHEQHGLLTPTLRELLDDYIEAMKRAKQQSDLYKQLPNLTKIELAAFEDISHAHEPANEPTTLDDEVLLSETLETNPFTGRTCMSRVLWVHVAVSVRGKNANSPFHTGRECMARVEKLLSMLRDEDNTDRRKIPRDQLEILKMLDVMDKQTQPNTELTEITTAAEATVTTEERLRSRQPQRVPAASPAEPRPSDGDEEIKDDSPNEDDSRARTTTVKPMVSAMVPTSAKRPTQKATAPSQAERKRIDVVRDEQLLRLTMEFRPFLTFNSTESKRRNVAIRELINHPSYTSPEVVSARLRKLVRVYEHPEHDEHGLLTPSMRTLIADYLAARKYAHQHVELFNKLPNPTRIELKPFEDSSHAHEPFRQPTTQEDEVLLTETVGTNPFTAIVWKSRVFWIHVASNVQRRLNSTSPFRNGRECMARVERLLSAVRDTSNPHGLRVPSSQLEMLKLLDIFDVQSQPNVDFATLRALPSYVTTMAQAKLLTAEKSTGSSQKQRLQCEGTAAVIGSLPSPPTSEGDEDMEDVSVEGGGLQPPPEKQPTASPAQMDVWSIASADADAVSATNARRTIPRSLSEERLKLDVVRDERFLRLTMELRPFATFNAGEKLRRKREILESMDHPNYATATRLNGRLRRLVHVYDDPAHSDHHLLTPELRQLIADYNTCWKRVRQRLEMYKTLPALSDSDLEAFEDDSHAHEPSHEPTAVDDEVLLAETVRINPFTGVVSMTRVLWIYVASNVRMRLNSESPFRTGRQCMDRVEKLLTVVRDEGNPHGLIVPRDQLEMLKLIDFMDKRSQRDVDLETLRRLPPCATTMAQVVMQPMEGLQSEPTPVRSASITNMSRAEKEKLERKNQKAKKNERLTVDVDRDERMMRLALERIKAVNSSDVAVRLAGVCEAIDHPYYATTYMVHRRIRWLHDAFKRPQGKIHSQLTAALRELIPEYSKIWNQQQDARKKIPSIPAIEEEAFNDHSHAHKPLHPPTMLEDEVLLTEIVEVSPFHENVAMARVLWVRVAANVQSKLNYNSPYRTGRACMARMETLLSVVRDVRNPQRRKLDGYQLEMLKVIDILDRQTRAAVDNGQSTSSSSSVEVAADASTQPVVSSQVSLRIPVRKPPQRGSIAFLLASIPSPPTSDDDDEGNDQSEDELLDFVGVGPLSPATPSLRSANEDEARVRPMSNFSRLRDETTGGSEIIVLSDSDSSNDEHDARPQDGHRYRRVVRSPKFFTPMMASHSIPNARGDKRKDRVDENLRPSKAAKTSTARSPRRPSTCESSQLQEMREEIAMLRAHITAREVAHEVEIDTLSTMLREERQAYRRSRTELVDAFEGERGERRDDFMQMMSVVTKAVLPPLSSDSCSSQVNGEQGAWR